MATSIRRSAAKAGQNRRAGEGAAMTSAQARAFTTNYRKTGNISFAKGTSKATRNAVRKGMGEGMGVRAASRKGMEAAASYYSGSKDRRAASRAPVERRGGRDRRDRRQG